MSGFIHNLKDIYFSKEYYLFLDISFYKKWWILIRILIFLKFGYRNCEFYRHQYKFYKNIIIVGIKKGKKSKRRTKGFSKKFLQKNKDTKCIYCESKLDDQNASAEHIIPISKGGNNSQINLIVACKDCNNERGDIDFLKYLRIKNPKFKNHKYPFV